MHGALPGRGLLDVVLDVDFGGFDGVGNALRLVFDVLAHASDFLLLLFELIAQRLHFVAERFVIVEQVRDVKRFVGCDVVLAAEIFARLLSKSGELFFTTRGFGGASLLVSLPCGLFKRDQVECG